MLSKIPRIYWVATAIVVLVVLYACSNSQSLRNISEQRFGVPFSRFSGAETLRSARMPELVAEIEKLIEQKGLPADVFVEHIFDDEISRSTNATQLTNIAQTLDHLFNEFYLQAPNDLQTLWAASPIGVWDVNQQSLDSVSAVLARFESRRQTIRTKLLQPDTHFYYIFALPESQDSFFRAGMIVNTEASKYLADYALLEEYAVAQALLEGNIRAATQALAYIFRIAQLASMLGNVGVRADAALVRLRAFDVMQRVILDPKFDRSHMIILRDMLLEQHEHWTPEYVTWFGDRASGISLYHRITIHGAENALEFEAIEWLDSRATWHTFVRGFRRHYEADAAFYLRSMQRILDVSDEPFVRRLDVLNQINRELRDREHTFDEDGIAMEPFVANILLKDIEGLMRIFAQDKSALNRAIVAMRLSLGQGNTDRYRDPFTDEPYEVQRVDGLLSVSAENLPHPFRVPVFAEAQ